MIDEHERAEPTLAHGVGPWSGARDTWPDDPRYDRELLAHGDTRNVVDEFRYWTMDAIVAELDRRRHGFHVAIENWQHDMNIGSIVRSANAFLAAEVHIIGRRRWNRRGAMVTDRYQHVRHHESVAAFAEWADAAGLPILAIDNVPGSVPVDRADIPDAACCCSGRKDRGSRPRRWPRHPVSSRSPSTARRGRSTRAPRVPSSCTSGAGAGRDRAEATRVRICANFTIELHAHTASTPGLHAGSCSAGSRKAM